MKSASRVALGLALGLGAASLTSAPALAKRNDQAEAAPALNRAERTALYTLKAALDAQDIPAATTALGNAQSVVRSAEGRYYLAVLQVEVARGTNNLSLLSSAVETLLASGRASQAEMASLYASQGAMLALSRERQRAEAAYTRAMELAPTPETALTLVQFKIDTRKNADAIAMIDRAIELRKASGQPVPESWYLRAVFIAETSSLAPQALSHSRDWVQAYPSSENWRDAILAYRDYAKPDAAALVDAMRLERLAKGLAGERDFLEAAQTFSQAGLPGEAKSVFDEAIASGMMDPAKPTFKEAVLAANRDAAAAKSRLSALRKAAASAAGGAPAAQAGDQLLSFGDYAGAAEMYRAALQKGGADADTVNTRLGIALALGGQRAEAEAAFRMVSPARSDLAQLWLVWLGQRAG